MTAHLESTVRLYIEDVLQLGPDATVAISPKDFMINLQTSHTRDMDIDDSDATLEATAVAEGLAEQDGMDYQTSRNWDLYPARTLIRKNAAGQIEPDGRKIAAIVSKYLRQPDNSRTPYTE